MNAAAPTTNNGRPTIASTQPEKTKVDGEAMVGRVKDLLHEGNVRRITIRNAEGHAVIEIPVTAGVVAAVVAPVLVGVAAIGALASHWEIEIDRTPEHTPTDASTTVSES